MSNELEMSQDAITAAPVNGGGSFSARLRGALADLPVGERITLRTLEDRQVVTNAVLLTKKKLGFEMYTKLVDKRGQDGKITVEIGRTA